MANPFDQFDQPAAVNAAGGNPFDQFDGPPQSPAARASATGGDRMQAVASGANAGIAGLAGLPVDTVLNVWDLAKAGAGTIQGLATGRAPSSVFGPTDRANVAGSSQWIRGEVLNPIGVETEARRPDDAASRYLYAGGQALPAVAALRPEGVATAARTAGSAIAGGLGAQGAQDAGMGSTGQVIAGLAAGGLAAPRAPGTRAPEFVTPPAHTRGVAKILEGIAGKQSVEDLASIKNQRVVNEKARRAVGLDSKQEITPKALQSVRDEAGKVYEQVANAGDIVPDVTYAKQLAGMLTESRKVGGSFKGANVASTKQVQDLVETLWQPKFDARSTVEYIKQLRDDSKSNLSQFNTDPQRRALGKAQQRAAGILESQLERHLQSAGNGKLYSQYKNARELIAKTYTIEKALNPSNGNVSALKLAKELQKGKPLSGDLRDVASAATATPKAFKTLDNSRPGFSPLDVYGAGSVGGLGFATTGDPMSLLAGAAIPIGRSVARNVLLSDIQPRDMSAPFVTSGQRENSRSPTNIFLQKPAL